MSEYELYHHGVKGQKWGIRNYQNEDGSYKPGAEGRYDPVSTANRKLGAAKESLKGLRKEQFKRDMTYGLLGHVTKKGRELDKQAREAKQEVKNAKEGVNKAKYSGAVSKYQHQFEKATKMSDKSDKLFEEAKQQYKDLAKTPFGRMMEVYKAQKGEGSKAAQKYLKTWEKASQLGDKSLDEWTKVQSLYKETGNSYVHRIMNNIKYDTTKKK